MNTKGWGIILAKKTYFDRSTQSRLGRESIWEYEKNAIDKLKELEILWDNKEEDTWQQEIQLFQSTKRQIRKLAEKSDQAAWEKSELEVQHKILQVLAQENEYENRKDKGKACLLGGAIAGIAVFVVTYAAITF